MKVTNPAQPPRTAQQNQNPGQLHWDPNHPLSKWVIGREGQHGIPKPHFESGVLVGRAGSDPNTQLQTGYWSGGFAWDPKYPLYKWVFGREGLLIMFREFANWG